MVSLGLTLALWGVLGWVDDAVTQPAAAAESAAPAPDVAVDPQAVPPVEDTQSADTPAPETMAETPVQEVFAAAPGPVRTQPAPEVQETPAWKGPFILRHTLMGVGVAAVALSAVALVVAAPLIYVIPSGSALEFLMPGRWRAALAVGLLGGVVPALLVVCVGGATATGVSAVRGILAASPE